jgi:Tol biopolymer transport system component
MADRAGVVQFWTISPLGGEPAQVTDNPTPVESAFTWFPDGRGVALVCDGSVCRVNIDTGQVDRLTPRSEPGPRPEACVVSPDGRRIAFVRRIPSPIEPANQICVVDLE